jgi:coproporphyrinogen III oxidase
MNQAASLNTSEYQTSLDQKQRASEWFMTLRNQICTEFEKIEQELTGSDQPAGKFEFSSWDREGGGGGTMGIMRGRVFEKVGVNISTVHGEFTPEFAKAMPGADKNPQFWASGISLVAHMHSPLVPAVHMNTRHIVTEKSWFGGGADLTPFYPNEQDKTDFHAALKSACDNHDPHYYPQFKALCDQYFYLPHRQEPRGIGGIFYDNFNSNNWENDFAFTQDVGKSFLEVYAQIIRRHMGETWTLEQRKHQLQRRGR